MLLITDLSLSENNPNNAAQTAGTTFVGQFFDHDMTFDVGSRLARSVVDHCAAQRAGSGRPSV